jgi:hypothetical protein
MSLRRMSKDKTWPRRLVMKNESLRAHDNANVSTNRSNTEEGGKSCRSDAVRYCPVSTHPSLRLER